MATQQCPAGTSLIMAGAVNDLQACRLWDAGRCRASAAADYCQDGADYLCPAGYELAALPDGAAALPRVSLADCVMCAPGSSCAAAAPARKAACPAGYLCRAYAESPLEQASPPGTVAASEEQAFQSSASACSIPTGTGPTRGAYCPPASAAATPCAPGYAAPADSHADASGCRPASAGLVEAADTGAISACPNGRFCPEASLVPLPCPAGT